MTQLVRIMIHYNGTQTQWLCSVHTEQTICDRNSGLKQLVLSGQLWLHLNNFKVALMAKLSKNRVWHKSKITTVPHTQVQVQETKQICFGSLKRCQNTKLRFYILCNRMFFSFPRVLKESWLKKSTHLQNKLKDYHRIWSSAPVMRAQFQQFISFKVSSFTHTAISDTCSVFQAHFELCLINYFLGRSLWL